MHCRSNLQISKSKSFTLKVNVLCFWFESSFHSFTAAPSSLQAFVDKSHKSSKQTTANPRNLLAMKVITSVVSYFFATNTRNLQQALAKQIKNLRFSLATGGYQVVDDRCLRQVCNWVLTKVNHAIFLPKPIHSQI